MTQVRLHTADELFEMGDEPPFILIDGRLVEEMSASPRSSKITARILIRLGIFVEPRGLGDLYGADGGFILSRDPDTVVSPDVAFVRADRLPESDIKFLPLAPDLAVEVLSPTDRRGDTERKVALYRRASVPLIWVIDPFKQTAIVYQPDAEPETLRVGDTLDGDDVLPGFTLPLADLFA